MSHVFPGMGSPLWGGPVPNPQSTPSLTSQTRDGKEILWRMFPYRLRLTAQTATPFVNERTHVGAMQIYGDNANFTRIYIGNRDIGIDGSGFANNSSSQIDPSRGAFIWTDDPVKELIDVAQWFAFSAASSGIQFLHITTYTPTVLG